MIAVIFEVTPKEDGKSIYFEIAQVLKKSLEKVDGFISIERFQSLLNPETFLSLSFWESERAIKQWREHFEHQVAQKEGKETLFLHYRIRVANVVRDYGSDTKEPALVSHPQK
jgi:heme-degrading monooxygenase HmoA